MASQPPAPQAPPESIVLGTFKGLKNTVTRERLDKDELEVAINIDLDDVGQVHRRRGYVRKQTGRWHSIRTFALKVLGVKDGTLGIIVDESFVSLGVFVGSERMAYTEVNGDIYFCNNASSGVVKTDNSIDPWGKTSGQGLWLSPVINDTPTLGQVSGALLGDPMRATDIEAYKGRIYIADGKTLWRTELYLYHLINRTRGFYQFEHEITFVMGVDDGLYVGTTGGLYFLEEERILMRTFGSLKLDFIIEGYVVPGSGVHVPVDLVHPGAMERPVGTGRAIVFLMAAGVMAGFNTGETYNLTLGTVILPGAMSAAALFRQDSGANHYVAATDSAGGPAANCRIGDYCEAEIVRRT